MKWDAEATAHLLECFVRTTKGPINTAALAAEMSKIYKKTVTSKAITHRIATIRAAAKAAAQAEDAESAPETPSTKTSAKEAVVKAKATPASKKRTAAGVKKEEDASEQAAGVKGVKKEDGGEASKHEGVGPAGLNEHGLYDDDYDEEDVKPAKRARMATMPGKRRGMFMNPSVDEDEE